MLICSSLLSELFRSLVPEARNRTIITWRNFPLTITYLFPLLLQAYLAGRPDTYYARLALLPVTVLLAIHAGFGYMWGVHEMDSLNWITGFSCLACSARAIELAFVKKQLKKTSELEVNTQCEANEKLSESESEYPDRPTTIFALIHCEIFEAADLLISLRGIGWNFGKDIYIPRETRPLQRNEFLIQTGYRIILSVLVIDFVSACQALVPGIRSKDGHSIFYAALPPLERYALSTLLHLITGIQGITAIQLVYDVFTILSVKMLHSFPVSWPPLFDSPWLADSLHSFWGRRWHQTQRRLFIFSGGLPGRFLFGEIGYVVGVFLASGLYHECAFFTMGRGWDTRMVGFFLMQGIGIVLERGWKVITGRRVGGWPGRIWTYVIVLLLGQVFSDSIFSRGIAGGSLSIEKYSPTVNLVWPIFHFPTGFGLQRANN